jgi:uncharacterized lipoprotein YehR (DUF1307 family)
MWQILFVKETFMKDRKIWLGMLAMVLVFGITVVGCDNNGGDDDLDPFSATWISEDVKIVAADGSWKEYTIPENDEVIRGTYTYSGNTVTAKITQVNTLNFGEANAWVNYANLDETYKGYLGGTDTFTLTITNNSFSVMELDFIVSPNFNGTWTHSANIPGVGAVTITNVISGSDVTIKMDGDNYQKGIFAFSSIVIFMNITHKWEDDVWTQVDSNWAEEEVTFEYTLMGNTFTLSNGKVDGDPPGNGKGENLPYFEGAWTR